MRLIWDQRYLQMLCQSSIQNQPHIAMSSSATWCLCQCIHSTPPHRFWKVFGFIPARSRDPLSPHSLGAQSAFLGPFWQLWPFWNGEFLPPLLFRDSIEGTWVAGNVNARSGLFSWKSGAAECIVHKEEGERLTFFSPYLRGYVCSDESGLSDVWQASAPSLGLITNHLSLAISFSSGPVQ